MVSYAIWRESVAREGIGNESGRSGFAPVSAALVVGRLARVGFRGASPRVPPYFAATAASSSSMSAGPNSECLNTPKRKHECEFCEKTDHKSKDCPTKPDSVTW